MIARVLDIPDEEAALAPWLDRQIVAPSLHEFVAELAVVHGAPRPARPAGRAAAAAWLGDDLPAVLARGTAALAPARLGSLLRDPWLLPGVQELAFVEGADHWTTLVMQTAPTATDAGAGLLRRLGAAGPSRTPGDPAPGLAVAAPRPDRERRSLGRAPGWLAALAACLLVAVATWSLVRPPVTGAPWGWNRPDALAAAATPDAYLRGLADAAAEWSDVIPSAEPQLAGRLADLLAGCDRLIAAPHEPLAPADREWLVERCKAWREKIAGHVAALAESHDVAAVRHEADATVEKLVKALRARAEEVRSRAAGRA